MRTLAVIRRLHRKKPARAYAPREPLLVYIAKRLNRPLPPGTTQTLTEPLLGFGVIMIILQSFDLALRPALLVVGAVVLSTAIVRPLSHRAKGIYWKDDRSPFQDLLLAGEILGALLLMLWLFTIWGPMAQELFA